MESGRGQSGHFYRCVGGCRGFSRESLVCCGKRVRKVKPGRELEAARTAFGMRERTWRVENARAPRLPYEKFIQRERYVRAQLARLDGMLKGDRNLYRPTRRYERGLA